MRTRLGCTHAQVDKKEGASVSRRPSKRQQEKAPEGRPPHGVEDAEGAEGAEGPREGESRFKEEL